MIHNTNALLVTIVQLEVKINVLVSLAHIKMNGVGGRAKHVQLVITATQHTGLCLCWPHTNVLQDITVRPVLSLLPNTHVD